MKKHFGLLLFLTLYAGYCALGQSTIDIKLKRGTFRGLSTSNGTEKWLGIFFALPPVGQLRFKAPVHITKASSAIMDASALGNACPQPATTLGAPIAEDCLFLNVMIPSSYFQTPDLEKGPLKDGAKLPVLFWLHVCAMIKPEDNTSQPGFDPGWYASFFLIP